MHHRLIAESLPKLETLVLNVCYRSQPALVDFLVASTALISLELIVMGCSPELRKHAAAQPLR